MPYLSFISDADLEREVGLLLSTAEKASEKAEKSLHRNVVDPFAMLFEIYGFELSIEEWQIREASRQAQKSLANAIGNFHQNVLGCVNGWSNVKTGKVNDLVNDERSIVAEVKNKHNTVKGDSLAGLHSKLSNLVTTKNGIYYQYTAYYVQIIPKSSLRFDKVFEPSDNERGAKVKAYENVRTIDGATFYDLATSREHSLRDLYLSLPHVVSKLKNSEVATTEYSQFFETHFRRVYGD